MEPSRKGPLDKNPTIIKLTTVINQGDKMTQKVFTIHDTKAETFNPPFFQPTHGEAERNFRSAMNDPKTTFNKYPEDFDLYYLGEYETNSGKFKTLDSPQHMLKGSLVLKSTTKEN